ncbi:hypothetical protein A1O1_03486 [Capronia coronata CBS 617.96]|uniref:Uncharacterized protein n=1 Tax=Capronia coronata CBS 617.96 TaxID=1182541 RepID=W9YL57_9EURO|nr:uncharacterized protein A1O1_03486 [Capronia coronata CBS 617.96]EXJ90385.1 hypothetical protein A1O1_03486 [Capronia coronata CBS 617.96]
MSSPDPPSAQLEELPAIPPILIQEAGAAAAAALEDEENTHPATSTPEGHVRHHSGVSPRLEEVPPPAYNSAEYGQLDISQNGLDTGARVGSDGRVNIKINQRSRKLTNLLIPALRHQLELQRQKAAGEPPVPEGLGETEGLPPPPMNIVIQIVGSRGDVQPFVALGQVLKNKYNHRVRIATHPTFKEFVIENGLEFFSIGGDPAELMAFMVKNPGLMPGWDSLKSGDVGKRRRGIYEIITGCWRSCIEAGDGTGVQITDDNMDTRSFDSAISLSTDPSQKPFVADAIIANPPSFAHVHIAEKLGIPLHLMFTMPWSPTQSFPHPLANIISSNTDPNMANFITYALVDMLTWQGLGDVINRFREHSLGLEPVSIMWAPGMISRLRIPWTYCWSPALIPKPADWGDHIDISGFFFLNLSTSYTPPQELADYLAAGPPPVYIGFGSIVVDDPNAMTKMIFEAVKKTGQRAIISKGWGGLGADEVGIPEGVFMLGNCPHDWLFKHVSCVVHHGGAGTTAAGILAGRPTVVVPFFGDQPFWGAMVARAGAGPAPIAYKNLTAEKLAASITEALKPESFERAQELSLKIQADDGTGAGAASFHKQIHLSDIRCSLAPTRTAVWRVKRTDIRLSPLAATVLGTEGLLDFSDLKLYRPREYETEEGPWEPISGGAAALIGTIGNLSMGVADFPVELLRSLKSASGEVKDIHEKRKVSDETSTPVLSSGPDAVQDEQSTAETSTPAQSPATTPDPSATGAQDAGASTSRVSSISTVLSPDGSTRSDGQHHRTWSQQSGSASQQSRPGSPLPHAGGDRTPCPGEEVGQVSLETALQGAKAVGTIVSAGMKSPLDFTLSLAKGFHNAPKLYGDETVRRNEKIVDLRSGLKVAGREFGYGFYDGITGLVTHPLAGAKKEGPAGFFKGAAKGFGGLILKPGAGIWGLPGYTAKGIYAEVAKYFGSSVQNYIIAARVAQGYDEWKSSTPEERAQIVSAWKDSKLEIRKGGKLYGNERKEATSSQVPTETQSDSPELLSGFKHTRHLSWDQRKALSEQRDRLRKEQKDLQQREKEIKRTEANRSGKVKSRCKFCPFDHDSSHHAEYSNSVLSMPSAPTSTQSRSGGDLGTATHDYEQAIQTSIGATSKGNPDEDAVIERALRASLRELHAAGQSAETDEDAAYNSAIKASMQEFKKAQTEQAEEAQETGVVPTSTAPQELTEDDHELERVLRQSLKEFKAAQFARQKSVTARAAGGGGGSGSDSGVDTDYDEDFKRVIEESKRLHTENEQKKKDLTGQGLVLTPTTTATTASTGSGRGDGDLNEKADEEAVESDTDEELRRAITASKQDELIRQESASKQKTEEEIVMEYVKKQSLLEEQLKAKRAASSTNVETSPSGPSAS